MAIEFKLDCVFYYVSDLDRTIGFYADVLGLTLDSRDEVARFMVGGLCLELVPATDPAQLGGTGDPRTGDPRTGNARVCLTVRDIHRTVAELEAMAVPVTAVRTVADGLLATFQDPDGNELELWQRTRPRGSP